MEQEKWKFHLTRVPWWGGEFEEMVRLFRQCLVKATGKAKLTKQELEEVILDKEMHLKNRPLLHTDDDIQVPVLAPNILIHGHLIAIPEEQFDDDTKIIKKQKQCIKPWKDIAWNTWNKEYLRALREKHNMKNNQGHMERAIAYVVLIK